MSNENKIVKQEPVEEIIVPPEEGDEILNKSGQAISKWNTIKHLLNDRY